MSWNTFQVVADKILSYGQTTTIDFAGMGEPTLNPDLHRFIAYVSDEVSTYITTNASALTSRNIERLVEAGLTGIIVSFNGAEVWLYEAMMGGLSFKRAESYLTDLVQRAEGRMRVVANVSVTRQTEGHLKSIGQYLKNVGVQHITFSKCHNRGGHLRAPQTCNTPMPPLSTGRCDIYANTLFVAWTGDALACCHDLDGAAPIGSVLTESLEETVARKQAVLQHGVRYQMCGDCNDLYRFSQDCLPDGRPMSDWVYNLCLASQERMEFLNQVILAQKRKISNPMVLSQLKPLSRLTFLRRLGFAGHQRGDHQGRDGSSTSSGYSSKSQELTLLDWMSLLYRQTDENTADLLFIIQQQEKLIAELMNGSELALITFKCYKQITGFVCRVKSRLLRTVSFL